MTNQSGARCQTEHRSFFMIKLWIWLCSDESFLHDVLLYYVTQFAIFCLVDEFLRHPANPITCSFIESTWLYYFFSLSLLIENNKVKLNFKQKVFQRLQLHDSKITSEKFFRLAHATEALIKQNYRHFDLHKSEVIFKSRWLFIGYGCICLAFLRIHNRQFCTAFFFIFWRLFNDSSQLFTQTKSLHCV